MRVLIGLGANITGYCGSPGQTLAWAVMTMELECRALRVIRVSPWYKTAPLRQNGQEGQGSYVNGVVLLETHLPPFTLLHLLKKIEARAGRRTGQVWGKRSLDLDIISYGDCVLNWKPGWIEGPLRRKMLTLPHPEAHKRPFVIRPLLDVTPDWKHPVTGQSATGIWKRLERQKEGGILERVKEEDITDCTGL